MFLSLWYVEKPTIRFNELGFPLPPWLPPISHLGMVMLILTGILSVGFPLSTWSSDLMSGEMNHNSSVANMRQMNETQQIETIAPVVVG